MIYIVVFGRRMDIEGHLKVTERIFLMEEWWITINQGVVWYDWNTNYSWKSFDSGLPVCKSISRPFYYCKLFFRVNRSQFSEVEYPMILLYEYYFHCHKSLLQATIIFNEPISTAQNHGDGAGRPASRPGEGGGGAKHSATRCTPTK